MVNLTFFLFLIIVQFIYLYLWRSLKKGMIFVGVLRVVIELAEKVVFLCLVKAFGICISVKTYINASGDLIIVGTDNNDR